MVSRNSSGENDLPRPPTLCGVLETVLYFSDQDRCERFYQDLLGMRLMDREPGRSLFFRAGDSVFLMFNADATLAAGRLPAHGARGPVHTCFRVPPDEFDAWKSYLEERGVPTLNETTRRRGLSFYFHDSEGNLLEIANADIWPD